MRSIILSYLVAVGCWGAPLGVEVSGWLLSVDKDGDEQLLEAETVKGGDVVVYEIRCQNTDKYPVINGVLQVPIPKPTNYVADSAVFPDELKFTCSIDGGESFVAEPIKITKKNDDGKEVAAIAGPARYTHLRWKLPELAPKKAVTVSFRSKVRKGETLATSAVAAALVPRKPTRRTPLPAGPARDRATVLAWPATTFPMLTTGKWRAPTGWADQFAAKTQVTGQGVRLDFSSQAAATQWSKAVAACYLPQRLDNDQVIALDVFSSLPGPSQLALGMQSNVFVESSPVAIRPGLNKNVLFDLKARNYKSEASNWAYRTGLQPKVKVREFYFIFYPQRNTGSYEIRGARLHQEEGK